MLRNEPFSMRSLEGLPCLTLSQKQRLLMEVFLDETDECEKMLAEIFGSDTSESQFVLHRVMVSALYNHNPSYSLQRDDHEYVVYMHAQIEAHMNEVVHQAETIRQLLEMAGMPSPEKDPKVLTLTVDDMRGLLQIDYEAHGTAHDLAEELKAVFRKGVRTDGDSFKARQEKHRMRKREPEIEGRQQARGGPEIEGGQQARGGPEIEGRQQARAEHKIAGGQQARAEHKIAGRGARPY